MLRTILTGKLIFLLLGAALHVDQHYQDPNAGYGICDIGCDKGKHHSISHQCEKCLNNNVSSFIKENNDLLYNSSSFSQFFSNQKFRNYFLNFSTYSRPPPSLI